MPVRSYSGAAKATTLSGSVTAAATVINVVDATGWPTGAAGPFVITIDAGVTTEEKVLISGRTGNSLTVSARGFDETTASDHGNAARVEHTLSATDIREANAHVNDTSGDPHPQYLTAAEGAALYPTLTHTHGNFADAAHSHTYDSITLRRAIPTEHTIRRPGAVAADALGGFTAHGFYVRVPAGTTAKLVQVRGRFLTGSGQVTINKNNTGIAQAALSVTGTSATFTPVWSPVGAETLADGDFISLYVVSASSGASDLVLTIHYDVTI